MFKYLKINLQRNLLKNLYIHAIKSPFKCIRKIGPKGSQII